MFIGMSVKYYIEWRGKDMIELTKLNDMKIMVNADIIEMVEETPDTVVTLTTGKKMIVKESRQEIRDLVIAYRRSVFCRDL